jgi:hypothetical protein
MTLHGHDDNCLCDDCIRSAIEHVTQAQQARPDATDRRVLLLLALVLLGYLLLTQWSGQ